MELIHIFKLLMNSFELFPLSYQVNYFLSIQQMIQLFSIFLLNVSFNLFAIDIDNLVNNIELIDSPADLEIRQKLMDRADNEGLDVLIEELRQIDPDYVNNLKEINKKRIVRFHSRQDMQTS